MNFQIKWTITCAVFFSTIVTWKMIMLMEVMMVCVQLPVARPIQWDNVMGVVRSWKYEEGQVKSVQWIST